MVKINGLDGIIRTFEDIAEKAKALAGEHNVPFSELLTPEFLSRHTRFKDFEEMLTTSGFKVNSTEDFKAIPELEWDIFVQSTSTFTNWQAMLDEAFSDWTTNKLGL